MESLRINFKPTHVIVIELLSSGSGLFVNLVGDGVIIPSRENFILMIL